MTLVALQHAFMDHLLAEDRALPSGWDAGMAAGLDVYRNAYRATLVQALRETFPRTALWVGDDAFAQAAAHHVISHPPRSWTLDHAGIGFVDTLAALFPNDPDVADLGWLEWAMHLAFTGPDCMALDAAGFAGATAAFGGDDWAAMRVSFAPTLALRPVTSDCGALWRALGEGTVPASAPLPDRTRTCVVWREGLTPTFGMADDQEGRCMALMRDGGHFGDLCALLAGAMADDAAASAAGAMLGRWLAAGWIAHVAT